MLGKLIRHEWKGTYKIGCLMLGAMVLITFLGWMSFQTPMWRSLSEGGWRFGWLDIFGVFTLIMYVVLLMVVNAGIVIYMGVRFYRTMYTDEGYLLHTLPVTKHEILVSKILMSSLWVLIIVFSMYLSIVFLGFSMVSAIMPDQYTMAEFWRGFKDGVGDVFYMLGWELGIDFSARFMIGVVMFLLTPFISLTTLFGAISIGQLASKHRVMTAILSYVGILIGESILSSIIRSMITVSRLSSFGYYIDVSSYSSFTINLLVAAGLYFVSWHVTSHKLNLE